MTARATAAAPTWVKWRDATRRGVRGPCFTARRSPLPWPPEQEEATVALTTVDRDLLKRCLAHQPGAWNDFVDRFLGLVYHVIRHTAHLRSVTLSPEDVEDLAAEIL